MKRTRVCSHVDRHGRSCPNLQPCPVHSRPANASWSRDRNTTLQGRLRKAVLARDGHTCTRCGHHDASGRTLVAHHVRPGYEPASAITLCLACHRAVDGNAR